MPLQAKASIGLTSLSDDRIKPCLALAPLPFAVSGRMVNRWPVKTSPTNGSLSAEFSIRGESRMDLDIASDLAASFLFVCE